MLKPSNYSLWAIRMQIILEANGLWEMIEPSKTTQSDNKKVKTAIAFLYQSLPEEQLLQITKHKTAKTIWDALKTRHIGEERVQQARSQTLKSDFEMLHMKEDETIDTFTTKLTTLVNKAASLGHTVTDEELVRKLLNAVPDRYLQIVASIEQHSDLDEMTLEVIGRLKTYEERIKYKQDKQVNSQESLMFTRHEGKRKTFREYGRGRFNQSRGQEQDKNNYQSKREERASFEENTRDKSQSHVTDVTNLDTMPMNVQTNARIKSENNELTTTESPQANGLKFKLLTLHVDGKTVPGRDGVNVYVSPLDARESSQLPQEVSMAMIERNEALAVRNYTKADALQKQINDAGYRVLNNNDKEILARSGYGSSMEHMINTHNNHQKET
nr:zinc finger, CCHC-type [Tanacetum cinerariifolium]